MTMNIATSSQAEDGGRPNHVPAWLEVAPIERESEPESVARPKVSLPRGKQVA